MMTETYYYYTYHISLSWASLWLWSVMVDGDGADCRLPIAIADCYAMPPPVISTWRFAQGDLDARQTKDPLVPTPDRRKLSKDTLQLVLTLDRRKIR